MENDYAKNMELSEQRAKWLVSWFIKNGIDKERFTFNGGQHQRPRKHRKSFDRSYSFICSVSQLITSDSEITCSKL